ncbi:putative membrane protein [Actinomadura luteofluorescens]|uniref:Putative membrane protein n=2 Tax=Actinomadura luteofluorescens TaxID=46163 RepID=A0A7Y9EM19_9ACTN|nr:SRPBCC family protein [Actinomadura luteofluorescens]NYD50149.1 putative membrane protein [Actinomadura luteofluorescens]
MTESGTGGNGNAQDLPVDQLKDAARALAQALMVRALEKASGQIGSLTERLDGGDGGGVAGKAAATGAKKLAEGESPLKAGLSAGATGAKEMVKDKVKSAVGGGGKGKGGGQGKMKVTNIMEEFDVGLPRRVAYDQWTQFADYPSFTKKVESVEQESDEKINWRAQVFLSHRTWESTIIEQVPDERIVWKSKGPKGYVDGAVTFHELAPSMTRVLLVAEYHPDGFFEKTANMWRAQGRRLRLDFKHIKRHMMTKTLLEQEEVEGWRGEIRDGEVVKTHEDALKEEEQAEEAKSEAQAEGEEKKPDERAEEPKAEQEDEKEKPEAEQEEKEAESARA